MEFGRVRNSHPLCDPEHTTTSPQPGYSCRGGVGWCWVGTIYLDSVVGGLSGGGTPGPIPNPEAKPSSADGTALDRVWESRTPPYITSRGPRNQTSGSGVFGVSG